MVKKSIGSNLVDPEAKKLFLVHRDQYAALKAKMDKASNNLRTYVKTIKGDGFSVMQIKDAIQLSTPEGEAAFRAEIANRLLAAAYSDSDIGDQLGLFLDNNRTPAVDRAYREGQSCAMENKAAVPKYDPDTEQYRGFMTGYHEEQERQVKKGIKKLEPEKAAANAGRKPAKGKKASAKVSKPTGKRGRPPGSGKKPDAAKDAAPPRKPAAEPVTRASLAAARKAETVPDEAASGYFTKSSDTAGSA